MTISAVVKSKSQLKQANCVVVVVIRLVIND